MGGVCDAHEREWKFIQNFGVNKLEERDHLEDLGVDGRMLL
jgi:hypothetical protein